MPILFCLLCWLWPAIAGTPAAELTDLHDITGVPAAQVMRERQGTWTFTVQRKERETHTGRFIEYTPPAWDGKTPLPLVVFLHGAGGRTEIKDTIDILYEEFIPAEIRRGRSFEAIVLCPQVRTYWGSQGSEFLDQAVAAYAGRFDPDRLYLTGLSSGGGGTWTAALERRELLAAAVPICGIKKPTDKDATLVDLPIWAFHNVNDPYQKVEYTRDHVEAIRKAGGRWLRYTEYTETSGASHPGKDGEPVFPACHAHAWITAYGDDVLWTWLFRQRRGRPELAVDP